ncbi:MAG: hypothetical protein C0467_23965 [Planctomycetaceae bacterium]|nr:hypothetical protein [Planctomycetaceae bacterium]
MRLLSCVFCCALLGASAGADDPKPTWSTIKGRVVFPAEKPIPKRGALAVSQDKEHCLGKGEILDESLIVNPKNRGIQNVVVFLRPLDAKDKEFKPTQIHPDDSKRKAANVVIDQPCCMFVKRVTVARTGDTVVVKNPSPVAHNFFWSSANNGDFNVTIPTMKDWTMEKKLVSEPGAILYKCTIHPWMSGYVRVFDHPYCAVTDLDGSFEIKNAPIGQFRIVFWHESGVRGGANGRFGEPIQITGPTMEMKPTDFDIGPK